MLREISLLWSMIHALVLFFFLFESRYSKKKTTIITCSTMLPLIVANTILAFLLDADTMGLALLLTLSLPSLIIFLILAKNRDGRFFFTFCLVDTVVLELIYITQILNFYISPESNLFMFCVRLAIFPLLEWLTFRYLRPVFLEVQSVTREGWGIFAGIGAVFYVLMTLMMVYPTAITTRPAYLPAAVLLFLLLPMIYIHILSALRRQKKLYEMSEQEHILNLQVNNMTARIEELAAADERFRMERHNYRHKMKTIASLLASEQYGELAALVEDYNETFKRTQVVRYCKNAVIDAVLSTYIKNAESKGIRVKIGLAFPDVIPVNEAELATVFANAIENAIQACEKLAKERRLIEIKVLDHPRFMVQIANTFDGEITFDEHGIPVNPAEDHGFGTRSIAAFCQKHHAHYIFKADGERFTLYLNF